MTYLESEPTLLSTNAKVKRLFHVLKNLFRQSFDMQYFSWSSSTLLHIVDKVSQLMHHWHR